MASLGWAREKYIYMVVLALLILFGYVIWLYHEGSMGYEATRVYLEVLTGIATLALLYFAYFNAVSKKSEDIARLELAVRPILVWELDGSDGHVALKYKALKRPIYDFRATLSCAGKEITLNERHMDVSESATNAEKRKDVTEFVRAALGSKEMRKLSIAFSYHSEAGGRYELSFTKEVAREGKGFLFEHRKFVSAKYPWRADAVLFGDEG